jgi:hypothetical protein
MSAIMDRTMRRRNFLRSASALGLGAGLGDWAQLQTITPASAAAMTVGTEAVRFRPEIEPVVRWIEQTPRERILEVAVGHLKDGLPYRDLLTGLFLAGIRNIKPHPIGYKLHAVLVINSAHILGQSASKEDRLLPLFWALDGFKNSQAQDVREGDWTLQKIDEARLPKPSNAKAEFVRGMENWDAEAVDSAVVALVRSSDAAETMEPIWRYAVRDQWYIGHKAIFAAQSRRTLQAIGWLHAEPVLRSLAFGLLNLRDNSPRAALGPYEANLEHARKVRDGWHVGTLDAAATRSLLQTIRQASAEGASAEAVALLNRGVAPQSLWDAVVLAACELMIRDSGNVSLHAMTAANALHHIFGASVDDTTRKLALLQAVGWLPLYRGRPKPPASPVIDAMEPAQPDAVGDSALEEIFDAISINRAQAASKAIGYLEKGGSSDLVFAAARRMILHKCRDNHDFKYSVAACEECALASDARWRAPLVAAAMFKFPGARSPDSPLMIRAREAVKTILG